MAAPVTTAATAPPTTLTPVDQVPAVITVEYVQRVMDALDKVQGDLTRLLVSQRVPSAQFRQMLTAIYDEPAFSKAEASFGRDAAEGLGIYLDTPGNPVTRITRILDQTPACIAVQAERDLGPELKTGTGTGDLGTVLFLRLKKQDRDPLKVNKTAWAVTADGQPAEGADLEHACH